MFSDIQREALGVIRAYEYDLQGPYVGASTQAIARGVASGLLGSPKRLGILSSELSDLVERGFVSEVFEERVGFEGVPRASRIRTFRLTGSGYACAQPSSIRFTTLTEQRT